MDAPWDKHWKSRTVDDKITRNGKKAAYLCDKLWARRYLIKMSKLEVGCGEGVHIRLLSRYMEEWKENYLGVDLSAYAVEMARQSGVNAEVKDFLSLDTDLRFNLFLFLDVLEHMGELSAVAAKVRELAKDDIVVIGNVPMAPLLDDTETTDRPVTFNEICGFVAECGCDAIDHDIYGLFGHPYLFFEATNIEGICQPTP